MKNKMSDVRDHLVAMMELLNDGDCQPADVEKAKALSMVAGQYVATVKTELDAHRLADDIGRLPSVIGEGVQVPRLHAIQGGR